MDIENDEILNSNLKNIVGVHYHNMKISLEGNQLLNTKNILQGFYVKSYFNVSSQEDLILEEIKTYKILRGLVEFPKLVYIKSTPKNYFMIFEPKITNLKDSTKYFDTTSELYISKLRDLMLEFVLTIKEFHRHGIACIVLNPYNVGFSNGKLLIYETFSSFKKNSDNHREESARELICLYESPELKTNNKDEVDPAKCDVYSIGIIFFNLITKSFPNEISNIRKILNDSSHFQNLNYIRELILQMIDDDFNRRISIDSVIYNLR